jgi:hypothetical protein
MSSSQVSAKKKGKMNRISQVWLSASVIPALGRLRQEDVEFQSSLGYTVTHCLRKPNTKTKQ